VGPDSRVSVGADAGVAVELVQTLRSVQTAVLVAIVVVHAAVIANVARRTHTPGVQVRVQVWVQVWVQEGAGRRRRR